MLNRGGTDQLRTPDDVVVQDLSRDSPEFGFFGAVDHIRIVFALVIQCFPRVFGIRVISVFISVLVFGFLLNEGTAFLTGCI